MFPDEEEIKELKTQIKELDNKVDTIDKRIEKLVFASEQNQISIKELSKTVSKLLKTTTSHDVRLQNIERWKDSVDRKLEQTIKNAYKDFLNSFEKILQRQNSMMQKMINFEQQSQRRLINSSTRFSNKQYETIRRILIYMIIALIGMAGGVSLVKIITLLP